MKRSLETAWAQISARPEILVVSGNCIKTPAYQLAFFHANVVGGIA